MHNRKKSTGFSLVELVIVIVIIGVIAAIAVPRISRGAAGAGSSALQGNLHVMRNAIDMFAAEHGGAFPTKITFEEELTQYTDFAGGFQLAKDATHIYGPYLVAVPVQSVGDGKGQKGVSNLPGATVGWIYVEGTGKISANSGAAIDDKGTLYTTY